MSTLTEAIKRGITSHIKDLHTQMPGIIRSFDPITQLASVQPAIKRIFKTVEESSEFLVPADLPLLINVLVIFPRGGGFSMTFPVSPGDECLLEFCERSIDRWHETGEISEPLARRFHSLSDATAIVGLSSLKNKVPNYDPLNTELKKDDGSVSIKLNNDSSMDIFATSDIRLTTSGDLIANVAGHTELTSPTVQINGDVAIDGTLDVTGATKIDNTLEATTSVTSPIGAITTVGSTNIAVTNSLTINDEEMKNHGHNQGPDNDGDTQVRTGGPVAI